MKIYKYNNEQIDEHKLLIDALEININKKNVISFVGGGGKTSLIYKVGNELKDLGKKVIITTTTHMFMPESNVVLTGKKDDIIKLLHDENIITVGMIYDEKNMQIQHDQLRSLEKLKRYEAGKPQKISGLPKETAESLIELANFVLVEADGAKRLPLKMPAEHEPVILKGSNLVVGVCGIDALGKKINETCHRASLVSKFLNADEEHIINVFDVAKILSSTKGQRKDVECDYKIIINKVDTLEDLTKAQSISCELANLGISETIITTFKNID